MMRKIISLCLILLLTGCATKWQQVRDGVYNTNPEGMVCRHRVNLMYDKMKPEGIAFDVVRGYVVIPKNKHVRLEYWENENLIILDPMQSISNYHKFVCTNRWLINQNNRADEIRAMRYFKGIRNE